MTLKQRCARGVYSALLRLLTPVYLARLWWRGRAEPLYRFACLQRLGWYGADRSADASVGWIWVHAVSLGETRAATALIDALRADLPGMRLLLTHTTATGREAGQVLLHEGDRQVWLPYDTPGATRRFMRQFRPRVGVLMETEVWPNLQVTAADAGVPMVLANARLSEKSLRQGLRFAALLRPAAQQLALTLAQTSDDAARLRQAGAPEVLVTGNLKFDVTPKPALIELGQSWRGISTRPIVLAASTREGEDADLLDAWLAQHQPRPRLFVVPRHPQRFDEVAATIAARGMTLARRSTWGAGLPDARAQAADVWLGDSIGEMPVYYAAADVALLGGSFAPLGGQNLIEAAACGCPLVMGPHTFNFAQAAEMSEQAGAARRVADWADGVRAACEIAQDPAMRAAMAQRATAFSQAHRGAAARMSEQIAGLLRAV
ncbi:3-deoxy-D-manno-octulosonic acid transferase [Aquabacterium sp.]|uniref:3-deoxy-D-manno-octulosonic acid transferase n=1 Tax=Aquabacterium sp. TaxID=1872578 RepID=UPI0035B085C3